MPLYLYASFALSRTPVSSSSLSAVITHAVNNAGVILFQKKQSSLSSTYFNRDNVLIKCIAHLSISSALLQDLTTLLIYKPL